MAKKKQIPYNSIILPAILVLIVLTGLLSQNVYSVKTLEVSEGDLVSLKVSANDENGDTLTYIFGSPLDENGQWQTQIGDYGEYDVDVTVSDGKEETTETIHLIVKKVNRAPVLEPFEDMVINEGDLIKIDIKATDEEGDKLTYSVSEPIGDDLEWQTGYNDAGEYNVLVTASDSLHTVSKSFYLTVRDVNRDPVISNFYPAEKKQEIDESSYLNFGVFANDPDEDELTYEWYLDEILVSESNEYKYESDFESSGVHTVRLDLSDKENTLRREWKINVNNVNRAPVLEPFEDMIINEGKSLSLEIIAYDSDNDELFYRASNPVGNDLVWETGYEDAGEYDVTLEVSDGSLKSSQIVHITVNNVDRAPLFQSIDNIILNEEQRATVELLAEDPDGDSVGFSSGNLPREAKLEGSSLIIEPDYYSVFRPDNWLTKFVNWMHLNKIVFPKSRTYNLELSANSADKATTQKVALKIENVNRNPLLGEMEDIVISETDSITLKPSATDLDNDRIWFIFSEPFDKNGKWTTDYGDEGVYDSYITVSDGTLSDTKYFKVIVNDKNRLPVFEKVDILAAVENTEFIFTPVVTDADGDSVEITSNNMPSGAKIINSTFIWTPGFDVVLGKETEKNIPITFTAFDGKNYSSIEVYINVKDSNRLPGIINVTPSKKITAYVNEPVYFAAEPFDYDDDELSYEWRFGLLDGVKGTPVLKRTFTETGVKDVKLLVSDGKGSITMEWNINVVERPVEYASQTSQKISYVIDNVLSEELSSGRTTYEIINPSGEQIAESDEDIDIRVASDNSQDSSGEAVTFAIE